jgi:hypothetical protein
LGGEVTQINEANDDSKRKKEHKYMENLIMQVVQMKINKKKSL